MGEKINCMLNEGKIGEGKGRKFASKMGVNALKADLSGCVWGFLCSMKKKDSQMGGGMIELHNYYPCLMCSFPGD